MQADITKPFDLSSSPLDALLNDREVASALRTSPGVIRNWRWRGRGPRVVRLGTSVRYRVRDILAYLDGATSDPTIPNE